MLASVELKKRENRDDLDVLQMNGYIPCSIYIYYLGKKKITRNKCLWTPLWIYTVHCQSKQSSPCVSLVAIYSRLPNNCLCIKRCNSQQCEKNVLEIVQSQRTVLKS